MFLSKPVSCNECKELLGEQSVIVDNGKIQ